MSLLSCRYSASRCQRQPLAPRSRRWATRASTSRTASVARARRQRYRAIACSRDPWRAWHLQPRSLTAAAPRAAANLGQLSRQAARRREGEEMSLTEKTLAQLYRLGFELGHLQSRV